MNFYCKKDASRLNYNSNWNWLRNRDRYQIEIEQVIAAKQEIEARIDLGPVNTKQRNPV